MSDNEYDGDEGDTYDVFANEEDEPEQEEPAQEETEQAEMEVVEAGDDGGEGLRNVDDRITTKYMTKYERARILGTRALQIRYGYSNEIEYSCAEIAADILEIHKMYVHFANESSSTSTSYLN